MRQKPGRNNRLLARDVTPYERVGVLDPLVLERGDQPSGGSRGVAVVVLELVEPGTWRWRWRLRRWSLVGSFRGPRGLGRFLDLRDPFRQRRGGRCLVTQRLGRGLRGVERVERPDSPGQPELVLLLLVGDEPARRTLGLDREPVVRRLIDAGFRPLPRRHRFGLRGTGCRAHPGTAAGSSRRSRMPRYAFHGPTSASYEPASPA